MTRTPDELPIRLNRHRPHPTCDVYHLADEPRKPAEPTATFPECPECGRSKARNLTLEEAHKAFGYASSSCTFCLFTDIARAVLA